MLGYTKIGPRALTAAAGLTAAIAFAAPAAAASHGPATSSACSPVAQIGRDEHTGQLWAEGYTTCAVNGPASMRVNIWVDNTAVKGASEACPVGTDCDTVSGMITPSSGRHRYCAQAVFYWAGTNPSQDDWSCEYLG
jgi:hypothetical protein